MCVRTRFSVTRWNEMPRESSPGRATELSPALQCMRENSSSVTPVERDSRESSPEGRPSLAQRFSVCVRTRLRSLQWNDIQENPAPEGRPRLAQRFSAGESGIMIKVPEGRPSSHAHSPALATRQSAEAAQSHRHRRLHLGKFCLSGRLRRFSRLRFQTYVARAMSLT